MNETIDRFIEPIETAEPLREFRCDQDEYNVAYDMSNKKATYYFDSGGEHDILHLASGQVEYYLASKYWQET